MLRATGLTTLSPARFLGWGILLGSLLLIELRSFAGPILLLAGLAVLLLFSRRDFLLGAVLAVPVSTIGWDLAMATIGTRTLDARLVVTFGVALMVGLAILVDRPRLTRLEWLAAAFVAWMVLDGTLRTDSPLTWMPPVARWFSYVGAMILARSLTRTHADRARLARCIALGFAVPAAMGLIQFAVGDSGFLNGAVRATAPGGRGPIGLAFAGQMVLVLSFVLVEVQAGRRLGWLVAVGVGALSIIASATRIITVTAWLALAAMTSLRRRWVMLGVVSVVFVIALAARPDLLSRYFGTVTPTTAPSVEPGESPLPSGAGEDLVFDSSLRFRIFVWETVLDRWAEQPLLGIGPGMTAAVVAEESSARRTAPHNDYVGILAELGIPGIALFLAVQSGVLLGLYRRWRHSTGDPQVLLPSVAALFVAVNVLGALNNPQYFFDVQLALWALVGASLAIGRPSATPQEPVGNI